MDFCFWDTKHCTNKFSPPLPSVPIGRACPTSCTASCSGTALIHSRSSVSSSILFGSSCILKLTALYTPQICRTQQRRHHPYRCAASAMGLANLISLRTGSHNYLYFRAIRRTFQPSIRWSFSIHRHSYKIVGAAFWPYHKHSNFKSRGTRQDTGMQCMKPGDLRSPPLNGGFQPVSPAWKWRVLRTSWTSFA